MILASSNFYGHLESFLSCCFSSFPKTFFPCSSHSFSRFPSYVSITGQEKKESKSGIRTDRFRIVFQGSSEKMKEQTKRQGKEVRRRNEREREQEEKREKFLGINHIPDVDDASSPATIFLAFLFEITSFSHGSSPSLFPLLFLVSSTSLPTSLPLIPSFSSSVSFFFKSHCLSLSHSFGSCINSWRPAFD